MNKKSNEQSIGDVLKDFLDQAHLKQNFERKCIEQFWHDRYGVIATQYTGDILWDGKLLTIKINSASFRNELQASNTKILAELNAAFPLYKVEKIKFS